VKFDGCLFTRMAECQRQRAGERVEPGQEAQGEFLVGVTKAAVELAQVHAAEVVFGVDVHVRPFTVGAVAPPARFGGQLYVPGSRPGDEAVGPDHDAIDRGQDGGDVQVQRGPVSSVRGVDNAGPSAGKAVGRPVPREEGTKPGQLAGQVAGGAWLAKPLDLRCPGECGRARLLQLHSIATSAGELAADKAQRPLRQFARGGTARHPLQLAHPRIRVRGRQQAGR
jgi:hypothetical protein